MQYAFIILLIILAGFTSFRLDKLLRKNTVKLPKRFEEPTPGEIEGEKRVLKPIRYTSKNEYQNHHKAALKARRQGHFRFMRHGTWYFTGLKRLEDDRV